MPSANATTGPERTGTAAMEPLLQSFSEEVAPVDPVALFRHAQTTMGAAAYWERPQDAAVLVGMGAAQQITLQGIAPSAWVFGEASREWQRLMVGARTSGAGAAGPLLLGGFAFDPLRPTTEAWNGFPAGLLTLPCILYRQAGGLATVTYSVVLPPGMVTERAFRSLRDTWFSARAEARAGSTPDRLQPPTPNPQFSERSASDPWQRLVADAAQEVQAGQLEKVVLARQLRLPADTVVDAASALTRLRAGTTSGLLFAIASGGRCFLGATPERLVRLQSATVTTAALAGSRRRGATTMEDAALEQELLRSNKDRWEHAIVVRELTDGLTAAGVVLPPTPRSVVMKLGTVQHLYTPLSGTVDGDCTILDLLERLHPTPAVGGYPRSDALAWIRRHEGIDRGWYAGPVGWIDAEGDGDFAVGIRSALLDRYGATLYAGCGIMGDSRPEDEFAESELKLRPMLAALQRRDAWIR